MVADAAKAEDSAAKEILFTAAIGLGNLAMIVVRRLRMKDQEFPLVKCGGVFGRSQMLDALLDSVLASGALRAKISRLEISPAVGAARMAARAGRISFANQRSWQLKIVRTFRPPAPPHWNPIATLLASANEEVLDALIENPCLDETHLCLLLERKDLPGTLARGNRKAKDMAQRAIAFGAPWRLTRILRA